MCGYICFFTGVPTLVIPLREARIRPLLRLRVAILLLVLSLALLLPDIIYYVLWQPEVLELQLLRPSSDEPVPDAGQLGDRRAERLAPGAVRCWARSG